MVDMFATKMNNKLPLYVSPVPDPNAMAVDALNISWEALDGYAYCPIELIPKLIKNENLSLRNDCSSPRLTRDELVLGLDRFFHKTSTTTSSLGNSKILRVSGRGN